MADEIFVVTSSGSGHLFPSIELCHHISSRNYITTLVLPSSLSSSVPSSFLQNPLLRLAAITAAPIFRGPDSDASRQQAVLELEAHLSKRLAGRPDPSSSRLLCAVVDFQMAWTKHVFWKFNVPVVGFFSFGACAAAMEHAAWKARVADMMPGETRALQGLPEEMSLSYLELQLLPRGGAGGGGPKLGNQPPWVPAIEGASGLMFNTCDDLERPFLEYMSKEMGMPVWAIGPLLPQRYWAASASASLLRDGEVRHHSRASSIADDDLIQWLDSKPRGSVLYVSFGSVVVPTLEEHQQLASALAECTRPFIWVMQTGSNQGLDTTIFRNSNRALLINGWAPQLLILSHPSLGGFLSHCGWNSTLEAIGLGVPILGWPIRGDQHLTAKLAASWLKIGHLACKNGSGVMTRKEDLIEKIEILMSDIDVRRRAMELRSKFENGFPKSSKVAFDLFEDFINQR
ncbi:hypothetical protein Nepgr_009006 [Nepenthes gracilis]|uniref:Glycosyltransferase n=1 Tax=Nepenthes gracilis TaxID=150966 RepID=A0AAD3SA43_NEPGR|nr:hypothetical protein Nepgr_009006 [Nepenthes gracilis]